jgi:hypothetical protein
MAAGGGYIAAPSHGVPYEPDIMQAMTPKENMLRVLGHDCPEWVPNGEEALVAMLTDEEAVPWIFWLAPPLSSRP